MIEAPKIEERWYVCNWYRSHIAETRSELEQLALKAGYESAVKSMFTRVSFVTPTAKLVDYHPASAAELERIRAAFNGSPARAAWYCALTAKSPDGTRRTWNHS